MRYDEKNKNTKKGTISPLIKNSKKITQLPRQFYFQRLLLFSNPLNKFHTL